MAGVSAMTVPTRALASLVGAFQPDALRRLQDRFPGQVQLLDPTYTLGGDESRSAGREDALRALIEAALNAASIAVPQMIKGIAERMRGARLARLAGTATSIVGAALIGAQTAGTLPKDFQLIWAAVSLAGSLLVLWGEHLEKPVIGGQRSLVDLLSEVLVAEASMADLRLRMLEANSDQPTVLIEIARRANEAAAKLRQVTVFGGISGPGT